MRYRTRLITCGITAITLAFAAQAAALEQRVPARVKRVIDGDTFKVEARVWPGITAQSQRARARRRHARDQAREVRRV